MKNEDVNVERRFRESETCISDPLTVSDGRSDCTSLCTITYLVPSSHITSSHIAIFPRGGNWLAEILPTKHVITEFSENSWYQLTHPNDTLATQDTFLYINIRGCNFLCKLRIPTWGREWVSSLNHPEGISSNSLQRNDQRIFFCFPPPLLFSQLWFSPVDKT